MLAVTTFGMWTPHVRKHRPGIVSLIAVSTALAMIAANTFLALVWNVRYCSRHSLFDNTMTMWSLCSLTPCAASARR